MGKVAKGEKEKCSIVFLKFYVDGAWNPKKYWCLKIKNLCTLMGYLVSKKSYFFRMLYFLWF
jgi:hypothetical protein